MTIVRWQVRSYVFVIRVESIDDVAICFSIYTAYSYRCHKISSCLVKIISSDPDTNAWANNSNHVYITGAWIFYKGKTTSRPSHFYKGIPIFIIGVPIPVKIKPRSPVYVLIFTPEMFTWTDHVYTVHTVLWAILGYLWYRVYQGTLEWRDCYHPWNIFSHQPI